MFTEDTLLPLSALQHLLFCPRQTALIHLERAWADNHFTAEGNRIHKHAHSDQHETRPGVRITRTLPVRSLALGVAGQCDIVEFHQDGRVIPIEYKRGKPKKHRADDVQVCAQALCLEEMLEIQIPEAFLFYGKRKRRTPVELNAGLRTLTHDTARRLHDLINSRQTPLAEYDSRRCDACSLVEICQPKSLRLKRGVASWFQNQLNTENFRLS